MKIKDVLIIDGATRENGYTKKLINYLKENLDYENAKVYEVSKMSVSYCDGCNFCEENEKCKFRDLDDFFNDFENADLIVFASPVYNGTFTAPIKAVIDRFQVYYTYFYKNKKIQKIAKRRKAVLLSSSGRVGEKWLSHMEEQLKYAFSVSNIEFSGSVLLNYTDTSPDIKKAKDEINQLTERIVGNEKSI